MSAPATKRIWGWFFYDWASQPYATLLLTFIFAPYIKELMQDGQAAQAAWGFGIGMAGIVIAVMAPFFGALADTGGRRLRYIWVFSVLYVIGAGGLWWAQPDDFNVVHTLLFFAVGLIGMEFTTIFTHAMLPDLGSREEIGRISGNGWAFGYLGGLLALIIMLLFFAENPEGHTLLGIAPLFGLDPVAREGTRFVGPFTAIWYVVFMIPFLLWVRDPRPVKPPRGAVSEALRDLGRTIRSLPDSPSLFAYLASSMFYRDALNGLYVFGGIYAAGVLDWSVTFVGIFGILAIITGALFAWLGGWADSAYGPKPVIVVSIWALTGVAITAVFVSRTSVFGLPVPEGSLLPDIVFFAVGAVIGATGASLQTASRTMMVRQANPERMNEAFGLYALTGKATSFIAPLAIGTATTMSGSQQTGIVPLIFLFLLGLILLAWVKPDGDRGTPWQEQDTAA